MPLFIFQAKERDEEYTDFLEAESIESARIALEDRRVRFADLRKAGLFDREVDFTKWFGISKIEVLTFSRFFASLLKAGIPLIRALELVKFNVENRGMKRGINNVLWKIQKGYPIHEALRGENHLFEGWYCNLIQIGEDTGELVQSLNRISDLLERQIELKKKVIKAFSYPLFICFCALMLVGYLMVFIVPKFKEIYSKFNRALPVPTQFLISISDFITQNYLYILLFPIVFVLFILLFRRSKMGNYFWNYLQLDIPLVGPVFSTFHTALMSKNLSTLISSGVSIVPALESVASLVDNLHFQNNLLDAQGFIKEGKTFSAGLRRPGSVIPKLALNMIEIGEESGNLPEMLENVANYYNEEVNARVEILTSALEPMLLIGIAFIVAGVVISLYLPIFGLAKVLSGGR